MKKKQQNIKKKPRKPRITGRGLWDDDGIWFTNPYFGKKLEERREKGLCIACGGEIHRVRIDKEKGWYDTRKVCCCKSSEEELTQEQTEKEKKKKIFDKEAHTQWQSNGYRWSKSKEGRKRKENKKEEKIERRKIEDERIANKDW